MPLSDILWLANTVLLSCDFFALCHLLQMYGSCASGALCTMMTTTVPHRTSPVGLNAVNSVTQLVSLRTKPSIPSPATDGKLMFTDDASSIKWFSGKKIFTKRCNVIFQQ
jgi:hypothetical protein